MSKSIIYINQYERRAIQYEVFTDNKFLPDNATIEIFDSDCNVVLDHLCVVESNKISIIVDETITATPDVYTLYWKIEKENQIFYKVTKLEVMELKC